MNFYYVCYHPKGKKFRAYDKLIRAETHEAARKKFRRENPNRTIEYIHLRGKVR